jgi:hypothetical protein
MLITIRRRDKNRPFTQVTDKKRFLLYSALVPQVSYMAIIKYWGYYKEQYKHCYI